VNFKLPTKIIFLLFTVAFVACYESEYYKKPSVIAGYKTGTFFDVHFFAYSDSTYFYSNSDKGKIGKWEKVLDTLVLKQRDTIQAILINYKPYKIYNPRYNWLEGMNFIENNPAKIVKFPEHE
jgi:hypothetical protein